MGIGIGIGIGIGASIRTLCQIQCLPYEEFLFQYTVFIFHLLFYMTLLFGVKITTQNYGSCQVCDKFHVCGLSSACTA